MLSKLAFITAVAAQYGLGDIDLSSLDIDISDIQIDSLYDNGDSCIPGLTEDDCPTKCCAKNYLIDSTPWIGYRFYSPN